MKPQTVKQALHTIEKAYGKSRDRDKFSFLQDVLEAQDWHEPTFRKAIGRMVMDLPEQKGLPNPAIFRQYYDKLLAEVEQERNEQFNQLSVTERYWYMLRRDGWKLPELTVRVDGRDPQDYRKSLEAAYDTPGI